MNLLQQCLFYNKTNYSLTTVANILWIMTFKYMLDIPCEEKVLVRQKNWIIYLENVNCQFPVPLIADTPLHAHVFCWFFFLCVCVGRCVWWEEGDRHVCTHDTRCANIVLLSLCMPDNWQSIKPNKKETTERRNVEKILFDGTWVHMPHNYIYILFNL